MQSSSAAEFLGLLLNRPVAADIPLRLSSAQRARFNAWLHERGVQFQDQRLSGEFTIAELLGGTSSPAAPAAAVAMPAATGRGAAQALEVGLDIQSVSELTAGSNLLDLKADSQMTRMFTLRELSYAQARPSPAETIAGLFAAKEAIRKCHGGPAWTPEQFRDIEVLPDAHGRPVSEGFTISISHSAGMAAAVACRSNIAPAYGAAGTAPQQMPATPAAPGQAPAGRFDRVLLVCMLTLIALQLAVLLLHRA